MTSPKPRRPQLPAPRLINDSRMLDRLRQVLRRSSRIALDTESNSLHAYREQVCLIQLSTDEADYLIDPLYLAGEHDLADLGAYLADERVEKVLHAAEYDVMCLRRDFGFVLRNLFDTQIAARILGWERVGLGSVLEDEFGIALDKRLQRANWGQRPLPDHLIRYAQMDTHYLLRLRDQLSEQLEAGGHVEEAREAFDEVCRAEWGNNGFDSDGFWRINGAMHLAPRAQAVLRELYLYRETEAEKRDQPLFKIMSDQLLVELAEGMPGSYADLRYGIGIAESQIKRFGKGVLRAVQRGMEAPIPRPPFRPRAHSEVVARYEALHVWRKERAARRGVESDVIMPKDALWEIAEVAPRTMEQLAALRSLGPWKRKTYGAEVLAVLAGLDENEPGAGENA